MTAQIYNSEPYVFLHDPSSGTWLRFTSPCRIVEARRIDEVLPLIRRVEEAVAHEGLYAAGFVSYEAAPAFDYSLPSKPGGEEDFPLVWFGLFRHFNEVKVLPCGSGETPSISWQPSITNEEYRRSLRSIHSYLREGDTYQVNFTYRLRAKTMIDPWDLFVRMMGRIPPPYAAFVDTGHWTICSASPELFLLLDDERITSRPMKGTAARGLWYEDDCARAAALRTSEKERAENLMIVDMMRNDLGRVAETGSVHVPALFDVERYPTVWQMTSTVSARTRATLDRILQATFPPASITGAPKRRAMEIIAELETSPRHVYTGTIGFIAPGRRAQFNVAIRTALFGNARGNAEYGVGGGIVWDSQPANEYRECVTKTRVLHHFMHDFDLLETILWVPGIGYRLLDYHMKRLMQSAEYFGFRIEPGRIRRKLAHIATVFAPGYHRVRLLVSRNGAFRCETTRIEPAAMRFDDIPLAGYPVDADDVFLYHKTTNRRVYEKALESRPGHKDVLLFNEAGEVTESTVANVAFENNGILYTPPVRCGLLPGTYRRWLLDNGTVREGVVTIEQVLRAGEIFLLNSVRGMHRIKIVSREEPEKHDQRQRPAAKRTRK